MKKLTFKTMKNAPKEMLEIHYSEFMKLSKAKKVENLLIVSRWVNEEMSKLFVK